MPQSLWRFSREFHCQTSCSGKLRPSRHSIVGCQAVFQRLGQGGVLSTILSAPRFSPRFYAGDRALGFFILEDLGPHRSLVEPLLEEDAASAVTALLAFATCLGKLHAATRNQSARFESLCHDVNPKVGLFASTSAEFDERTKQL